MIAYQKDALLEDRWRVTVDSGIESMDEEMGPSRRRIMGPGDSLANVNSDTGEAFAKQDMNEETSPTSSRMLFSL